MSDEPSIAVCLVSGGITTMEFTLSLADMMGYARTIMPLRVISKQGPLIHKNRNDVVQASIDANVVASLWIDTDIIMPNDTLLRLMAHNKDIVGATYSYKKPRGGAVGKTLDGLPLKRHGLREMEYMGMGCVLIKAEVFQKIPLPWFELKEKPGTITIIGEDVSFFWKARHYGYTVWCDQDLSHDLGHIGHYTYRLEEPIFNFEDPE